MKTAYAIPILIAILLLILSITEQNKRRVKRISFMDMIKKISESEIAQKFFLQPDQKKYKQLERNLKQAGYVNTKVATLQVIKLISPLIGFGILLVFKLTNIINYLLTAEKIQRMTSHISDYSFSLEINLAPMFLISLFFYVVPDIYLKLKTTLRNARGQSEAMILMTYAVMMLKAKRSVKQVLVSLMERSYVYREPFEVAVNSYSTNPTKALKDFKDRVGQPQLEKIGIALEQALNRDSKTSLYYLENHRVLGKELNRINRKKKNTQKSMFGLVLLILPLSALAVVAGYPWLIFAFSQFKSVPI